MKNLVYIGNELRARGGTPTSIDILAPLLRAEGFTVHTASSKKNQLLRLSEMLTTIIRHHKSTDAVLIDTYSTRNFWYAVLCVQLCNMLSLDYILLLHGGDLDKRLKTHSEITGKLFKNALLNICPSSYMQEILQQAGVNNTRFIPNPVRLEDYKFKLREKHRPRLLWVRSFAEIYNPLLALKVLEDLLKDHPEVKLCMVGPQKDESFEECQAYAREKNLPVDFPGLLTKEEWIKLSSDYDIFLNTTDIDNTPVSVIEAMALGLPVVSTNVGGMPFLIDNGKTGLLVSPRDVNAMLNQINFLLEKPEEAQRISFAAREKVEAFDWEVVKNDWIELLELQL
ncbi:glycosyltransferase family 4 protein [Salegentibacter flavus]|uniref:Glycosyltransferase involved in cell wall bisynthesis n=1 Tax=Salegentibacter flavus TaxID=287099 RepID=A0A1I4Y740_9FLAO|nr:glycosyltransferase family 4 protein [Salegentibacter flavus]SFN33369.1 Glycosyltransferase involved in cell wall bisynthesis [Salegentibacter flavus]